MKEKAEQKLLSVKSELHTAEHEAKKDKERARNVIEVVTREGKTLKKSLEEAEKREKQVGRNLVTKPSYLEKIGQFKSLIIIHTCLHKPFTKLSVSFQHLCLLSSISLSLKDPLWFTLLRKVIHIFMARSIGKKKTFLTRQWKACEKPGSGCGEVFYYVCNCLWSLHYPTSKEGFSLRRSG